MILSWLSLRIWAAVLVAAVLCVAAPSAACAQVVLTFVAKRSTGGLDFPHSLLRITGTTQSGEAIDRNFGFMPVDQSFTMILGARVSGAVIDRSEASIPWDIVTPHLSVQIPDTVLDAVIVRFRYWNTGENGGYDVFSQNCIAFLADIAGTVGLTVPPGDHLSPGGFLSELAEMNPPGSHPGILAEPIPNPVPAVASSAGPDGGDAAPVTHQPAEPEPALP